MSFNTTNWNLISQVHAPTTRARHDALSDLCLAYWYPLYSFARVRGSCHEDAADLTQAFFVHLIEKHALRGIAPENGRFRSFLLASFKHFQSEARRRAQALKRGGQRIHIPWNPGFLEARYVAAAVTEADPEQLFHRQWALTLIDRARARLGAEYRRAGKIRAYQMLLPHLAPQRPAESLMELAYSLGTTEGTARVAVHRFRRRFASTLRAEVASTVAHLDEVESELRFLFAVLRGQRGSTA
jgi:RNA polymerase sigma factor (sigma-70 family)